MSLAAMYRPQTKFSAFTDVTHQLGQLGPGRTGTTWVDSGKVDASVDDSGYPTWSRRSHRALPTIAHRRLSDAERAALGNERRLIMVMIVRVWLLLAVFVAAAMLDRWIVAAGVVYFIYSSVLTAVHHLIHGSLGLGPRARRWWMCVLALVVTESGHALQTTHLLHHRGDPDLPDPEGYIENVTWRQLPVEACRFRFRMMWWGWRYSPHRRRVVGEIGVGAAIHLVAVALAPFTLVPLAYVLLIRVTAVAFAVYVSKGPHANWGRPIMSPFVRVTSRFGWIPLFSHDRHLEHHIYPSVPLPFLPKLNEEIAEALAGVTVVDVDLGI